MTEHTAVTEKRAVILLSGGLDSSVISAIAKKYAGKRIETDNKSDAWWPRLHSFAIGLEGSPDLAAARKVADRVIFMDGGIIVEEGPAAELINNPRHERTKAFLRKVEG